MAVLTAPHASRTPDSTSTDLGDLSTSISPSDLQAMQRGLGARALVETTLKDAVLEKISDLQNRAPLAGGSDISVSYPYGRPGERMSPRQIANVREEVARTLEGMGVNRDGVTEALRMVLSYARGDRSLSQVGNDRDLRSYIEHDDTTASPVDARWSQLSDLQKRVIREAVIHGSSTDYHGMLTRAKESLKKERLTFSQSQEIEEFAKDVWTRELGREASQPLTERQKLEINISKSVDAAWNDYLSGSRDPSRESAIYQNVRSDIERLCSNQNLHPDQTESIIDQFNAAWGKKSWVDSSNNIHRAAIYDSAYFAVSRGADYFEFRQETIERLLILS
ncbi:MAG: hypothetical protein KDD53_12540, partial [Bdellovibrionales bacterium]|nr:hypothetical protein [Bdellovibrionales bacterium]